jgi:hypothetical protein
MNEFDYAIRSGWSRRSDSPTAIGAMFLNSLDSLSSIDPIFKEWQFMDLEGKGSLALHEARSRMTALVERNVVFDDFHKPDPDQGYYLVATTGKFKDPRSTTFTADAGGTSENGTVLQFGEWDVPPDLAIITYPLFKAALLAINNAWRPLWASAHAFRVDYGETLLASGVPLFPYSRFHIPWIAYLAAPLAGGVALSPEIRTARTPDGGLLMIATEDRLDPTNPEHLQRARIIAETMIARVPGRNT